MQHTKNHKFNLIETTDTFSPEPLNQNMETLEQALGELAGRNDAGDAQTAALAKRITSLEGHHFSIGTFKGETGEYTVYLGFTPKCIILGDGTNTIVVIEGTTTNIGSSKVAELRGNALYIYGSSSAYHTGVHPYIAFI